MPPAFEHGAWPSPVTAPGLGPGDRRFESCRPDFKTASAMMRFFCFRMGLPRRAGCTSNGSSNSASKGDANCVRCIFDDTSQLNEIQGLEPVPLVYPKPTNHRFGIIAFRTIPSSFFKSDLVESARGKILRGQLKQNFPNEPTNSSFKQLYL